VDEYVYLYQAKIFAIGRAYLPATEAHRPLLETAMILGQGRLYAKYPPGYPALLSLAVPFHATGIVNPLLGVLTLFLFYQIIVSFLGRRYALIVILLFATNSYLIGYCGSYFSQAASLFTCTLAIYFHRRYQLSHRAIAVLYSGLAIGLTVLVRPLDALCVFLGLACSLAITCRRINRPWDFCLFVLGPLIGAMTLVAYNAYLTGALCIATYPIWDKQFHVVFSRNEPWFWFRSICGTYLKTWQRFGWPNLYAYFLPKLGYLLALLSLLGFYHKRRRTLLLYGLIFAAFILLYNFHDGLGFPLYGARYWYPSLACLAVLAAHGLRVIRQRSQPGLFLATIFLCLFWNVLSTASDLAEYSKRFERIELLRDDLYARCPEKSIVVLIAPENEEAYDKPPDFFNWRDLKRNSFFSGSRLFVYKMEEAKQIATLFPEYKICRYVVGPAR
jgi:hypothetical protein